MHWLLLLSYINSTCTVVWSVFLKWTCLCGTMAPIPILALHTPLQLHLTLQCAWPKPIHSAQPVPEGFRLSPQNPIKTSTQIHGQSQFLKLGAHAKFCEEILGPGTWLSGDVTIWSIPVAPNEAMPRKKKHPANNLDSWIKAVIPIDPDTPDDPDYESSSIWRIRNCPRGLGQHRHRIWHSKHQSINEKILSNCPSPPKDQTPIGAWGWKN